MTNLSTAPAWLHLKPRSRLWAIAIGVLLPALPCIASDTSPAAAAAAPPAAPDPETISRLVQRLDAQDNKIREQDARIQTQEVLINSLKAKAPESQPAGSAPAASTDDAIAKRLSKNEADIKDVKDQMVSAAGAETTYPTLQFHGFGDVDYRNGNRKGDNNSFALGEFDLFLNSQLSEQFGVLSETVVSADSANVWGLDVERLMLQYHGNEYFNVDAGRFHTAVGYYNTAYHHGTWFQTAVGRPLPLNYEDSGGVIPAHMVGLSFHGAIPYAPASLGLRYFAEIGNGRQYLAPGVDVNPVANIADGNMFKAFNLAVVSTPECLPGLELGTGIYHDTVTAAAFAKTDEIMINGHAVYKNANWEILSEGYAIRHQTSGNQQWSSIGFVQLAHKFGAFTPYARFTYFNAAMADPVYQLMQYTGRHYGPGIGVRYDASTFVALKLQYDYVVNHGPGYDIGPQFNSIGAGSYSQITAQAAFTF